MAEKADPSPQDTGTLATAATAFEKILDRDSDPQEPKKPKQADPPPDEEEDADEDDAETSDDEGEEPEPEGEEGDEDEGDDEGEEADDPDAKLPAKVTVKVDGKATEVTLDEVVAGYQRHVDYSRKTEALAQERKQFFEQEVAPVREERKAYSTLLPAIEQQLRELQAQEPNWDELWNADPIEWYRQRELKKDRETKISAAQFEQQRLQAQQAEERSRALAEHLKKEKVRLGELIPEANDAKRWGSLRDEIREYAMKTGYTPEEISEAYDARAIAAMVKAMKYDKLMNAKKPTPDPAKPAKAVQQGRTVAPRPVTQLTRAKERLAKTGKLSDAAAVFEKLL